MTAQFEIQLIAVLTSVACALSGTFLVLRKMSMMSDAITHTILLGIVLAFFATGNLSSPLFFIGAAAVGLLTVWLTEAFAKTRLVSEDSAIGMVFPLLFSVAVILISRHAGDVHLDTDSVLLGELAFAPFDRMEVFGKDIGARGIYTTGALLIVNILYITAFYKESKLTAFDPMLAAVLGISPVFFHYSLMGIVSLTAVGAFEAVGSVLVVAFMIAPPITARLFTGDLAHMIVIASILAAASALSGYAVAIWLDVSIAGSMALCSGVFFLLSIIFAPQRGIIALAYRKRKYSLPAKKK